MIYVLPFVLQGVLLGIDEFYCHRRRTMRFWERVGHPLDTLTFIACLVFLYFAEKSANSLLIYAALAIFSCLFITKDEWEHRDLTTGFENWLHSLLFILHPIVLIWAAVLWEQQILWPIEIALIGATLMMLYQALYWNVLHAKNQ